MGRNMRNIIERIETTLKNDKEALEEFENLGEETKIFMESSDEYIFEGRVEALEWVLEIIKGDVYPDEQTQEEFQLNWKGKSRGAI
tara:strand:+ start:9396 stop:9653 length:258 start_codon:yes stop_codon:yes gene_type:complete